MTAEDATPSALTPNLAAQERNNLARIAKLRSSATPGFRKVFDLVPSILHLNSPDLPCFLDDPNTPAGLLGYDKWLAVARDVGEVPDAPPLASGVAASHSTSGATASPLASGVAASPSTSGVAASHSASGATASPSEPVASMPSLPAVESLVLIGSMGSVGHTDRSDLDYWVCYRPSRVSGNELDLFRRKLDMMTKWASDEHGTEANFYLVDLSLLERGQISRGWGQDVDGDAAPLLLLEELYRTLILVAGRRPLWPAVPVGTTELQYIRLARLLAPLEWEGEPPPYVDMGFPRRPEPQEYLAAAMWLTYKSEAYPFKGILKMIPILEAVETGFTAPLLCEEVKAEIASGDPSGPSVDPYLVTVERVIAYAASRLNPEQTDLIRAASVLKILGLTGKGPPGSERFPEPLGPPPAPASIGHTPAPASDGHPPLRDAASGGPVAPGVAKPAIAEAASGGPVAPGVAKPTIAEAATGTAWADTARAAGAGSVNVGSPTNGPRPDPFKEAVLERWMREWGWGPERLSRLLDYDSWSERERLILGNAMLLLLFGVYMQISNRLMTLFPDQVDAQDEELTPFAARIMGRQRGLESTVDLLPSQFHRDGLSRNLAIHRDPQGNAWSVYAVASETPDAGPVSRREGDLVYRTERAVRAAAWLVRNRLFGDDFHVCLDPGTVDPAAFLDLLETLERAFPPVSFRALDPERIWLVGAQGPVILSFNFETPTETARILSMDAVFRTGWGEIRHEWLEVGDLPSEADKCLTLASLLSNACGVADPENLVFWGPGPFARLRRAFSNVKAALAASLARAQTPNGTARSLLDL
ncbi:MAG: class I adenylate cyclase [Deltaproteobacteria bacterium]|jgi:adenylate cyclase|nr:class I adenylate cyclase [Deltaproteobacteria bacterium]